MIHRAPLLNDPAGSLDALARRLAGLGPLNLLGFMVSVLLTPLLTFLPGIRHLESAPARLAVCTLAALTGGLLLRAWRLRRGAAGWGLGACLATAALLAACVHVAAAYSQEVSTYPLTMGWSETSRYYYASLFFAERIYGAPAAPTVLHPSRYLLQALPFLIPDSPLWLHRLWQACLWIALPALTARLLARRVAPDRPAVQWLVAGAAFGYLMIGPVYYHLLVPVILVLWGFDPRQPLRLRSVAVVVLAAAWAGISRVNWYPVPGLLAATLVLLEQPIPGVSTAARLSDLWRGPQRAAVWRYIFALAGWTLGGTLIAFVAQVAYIAWSGNAAEQFTSSFTSDLLWSRLLPNTTFAPGILLGAVLVSLPVDLILLGRLMERLNVHPVRWLGLAAILAVLLGGGLLVSVKIGGGSNLHNLDAYLALLAVVGAYFAAGRVASDSAVAAVGDGSLPGTATPATSNHIVSLGIALAVTVVIVFTVTPRGPAAPLPERAQAQAGALTIVEAAEETAAGGGEVLFLTNRHLLTFHDAENVALVPDYERVFLMEAAMSGDPAYLGRFYAELQDHRFALIVSEPLSRRQKGAEDVFGAENDAWVKRVARQVLCYYEPVKTLRAVQVQLLVPRATPDPTCD